MSTRTPRLGLPPLVSQASAAAWLRLDRSRLSQLKTDPGFPQPLPPEMLHAIVGPTRTINVWTRDALVRWAQNASPVPRYPNDRPIPIFPSAASPLRDRTWTSVASGTLDIRGTACGWNALDCERSILIHAYGTATLGACILGDQFGRARLVSAHALSAIAADVAATLPLPEFFTVLVTTSNSTAGEIVGVTGSIADVRDGADNTADLPHAAWAIGRTLTAPDEANSVLGYESPWFDGEYANDVVRLWTPDHPVPIAVFDPDALFAHQAAWWLGRSPNHALVDAVATVAASAEAAVHARYAKQRVPPGWASVTDLALPAIPDVVGGWSSSTVSAAAARLRDAGEQSGIPTHLISYASGVADSQFVRIPTRGLPLSFLAAAKAADTGPVTLVADESLPESLMVAMSDVGTATDVPVLAEMSVQAVLRDSHGSAKVALHVDNSLSVSTVEF